MRHAPKELRRWCQQYLKTILSTMLNKVKNARRRTSVLSDHEDVLVRRHAAKIGRASRAKCRRAMIR